MNKEVLAVVAGEEITQEQFDLFAQGLPREQQGYLSNPQFKAQVLEQLIALFLYAKKGEELKLEETEEFKNIMTNAKRDILAQMAMREVLKDVEVSEEELKTFYDENQAHYEKAPTVSAKHILVADEDKCKEILAEIEGGKTFELAAQAYSTCPSGQRGGDLGEFGKGQMVPEFEQAAFEAEIGQVVGPVKTQFGFHLIKVEKKNEGTVSPFEEVKESIRKTLVQQKQGQLYGKTIDELKVKYM